MHFKHSLATLFAAFSLLIAPSAYAQTVVESPNGPWSHSGINISFPQAIGDYARGQITEYSDDGHDASVGYSYQNADGTLIVTIYVYPAYSGYTCAAVFADAASYIEQYPGSRMQSFNLAPSPSGNEDQAAMQRRYWVPANAMREGVPEVFSDLYLYCPPGEKWLIKYRASWSGSSDTFPDYVAAFKKIDWNALKR